jgi:hypothetical protein
MTKDLTQYANEGYSNPHVECPYYYSSPCFIAWAAGRWLALTHRSAPRRVAMSRGMAIRANDMLLKWHGESEFERIN